MFVLAYDATNNDEEDIKDNKKYFPPKAEIKSYKVFIDGKKFYDQPINELIKQYDEVRKVIVCLVMSRSRFQSEAGAKSEGEVTATGLEPRIT